MYYYIHYSSYVSIQTVLFVLLYCCIMANALHAYVDCVTYSISVKIYGR